MVFNCVICYALLSEDKEIKITSTYCGHLYHSDCILNWLERNNTCPVCRQTLLKNKLFQVYPTFDEENDAHLDFNCPAHALTDALNNLIDENLNLREELKEMREKYNKSNYNLHLKQLYGRISLESLELQLEKMTLEKEDLEKKLTSMDEHKKKFLDKHNELQLNFDSILIENNQICNKMKENEGELKLVKDTLMLSNSELDKTIKKLSSVAKVSSKVAGCSMIHGSCHGSAGASYTHSRAVGSYGPRVSVAGGYVSYYGVAHGGVTTTYRDFVASDGNFCGHDLCRCRCRCRCSCR